MNNIHGTDLMNWEAIKKIYMEVLVYGARIEYMGHGECETVRLFNENLISFKYNNFGYNSYVNYTIKDFGNNKYTKRSYYQDGTKKWKTQYKNDLRHGISMGWDYTGRKIYNQKYINGVPIPMKGEKMIDVSTVYNKIWGKIENPEENAPAVNFVENLSTDGLFYVDNGKPIIDIKSNSAEPSKNCRAELFTLIHELGHWRSWIKSNFTGELQNSNRNFRSGNVGFADFKRVLPEEIRAWYFGYKYVWKELPYLYLIYYFIRASLGILMYLIIAARSKKIDI